MVKKEGKRKLNADQMVWKFTELSPFTSIWSTLEYLCNQCEKCYVHDTLVIGSSDNSPLLLGVNLLFQIIFFTRVFALSRLVKTILLVIIYLIVDMLHVGKRYDENGKLQMYQPVLYSVF